MKFYTQSFTYDDSWSIVSLAYFLRYPNPYASHILSCDVISRELTPAGTLLTTRLILKRGIISRTEAWVIEESEVDPLGKTVQCRTKNLEFTKVMQVEETAFIRQNEDGQTLQTNEARIRSRFGWGLTKRIEAFGMHRVESHVQRSRDGISLILNMIRQSRQTLGAPATTYSPSMYHPPKEESSVPSAAHSESRQNTSSWRGWKGWLFGNP
ncbi:MSF1-domain-containing protein [Hymenopellis radicata]|nr:MSF1-domain-containing protein [Hymenopellis radicata]